MPSDAIICCDANLVIDFAIQPNVDTLAAFWKRLDLEPRSIVAPSLLHYGITNAIHRFGQRTSLSTSETRALLQVALDVPIQTMDDRRYHERALAISQQFRLPAAYDAHYLALAESLTCPFYTSDAKLIRAVGQSLTWTYLV